MKKTQRKDALRNIKKRIVSFLSICIVIALGFGVLFTTRYTSAGLDKEYGNFFRSRNFKDYEMLSSLGAAEENIDRIKETQGVVDAEGAMVINGTVTYDNKRRSAVVCSMTERVSVPEVIEGRLPEGKAECLVAEDMAENMDIKVGDKIAIRLQGSSAFGDKEPLYSKEFTVTGLMNDPEQFSRNSVNRVRLPLEAYNKDATDGLYTEVFVRAEEPAKVSMFSEKYFEETADTKKALEELSIELSDNRTKGFKEAAYAEIDAEWAKAQAKLDKSQAKIDDYEAKLNSGLADGRDKLNGYQSKLNKTVAKYKKKIKEARAAIAEARATIKMIDERLPEAEKYIDQMREKYKGDITEKMKEIVALKEKLEKLKKIAEITKDTPLLREIAEFVLNHADTIRSIKEFFASDEVQKIAEEIKKATEGEIDPTKIVSAIANFDVEGLIDLADNILNGDPAIEELEQFINSLESFIKDIEDALAQLDEYDAYIKKYEENRASYIAQIDAKEKQVDKLEKKLKAAQKKYQKMIDAGWSRYYASKARYEAKLAEAIALLETNREEAEKKLEEAKQEVENTEPCNWILLDRTANAGYVTAQSNIKATTDTGNIFGLLFMLVTAIVCFSTLVIIIDEQKKLVGTAKAFGFHKGEVLGKYLVFGTAAAVVGNILAIILGLVMSRVVQKKLGDAEMTQVGVAPSVFTPGITLAAALLITAVVIVATVIACGDILRSPASMLMNGAVLKKKSGHKKESTKGGSLYSKLIIRNMKDDKARVIITIVIIAFSTMLIGMGMSMKLAFTGMIDKQTTEVAKYDFIMNVSNKVSDEKIKELDKVLDAEGVDYLPANISSLMYKWDGNVNAMRMICADPERLGDFYAVTDPKTGEEIKIPDDGILIQHRMHESFNMNKGDKLTVMDSSLVEKEVEVKGYFTNYYGRMTIASPAVYKSIFGEYGDANSYYIKLEGANEDEVKDKLLAVTDGISFSGKNAIRVRLESSSQLYNIMVVVITAMAIFISFMILTNLSNIFLNRRKRELSVMRVNGFSVKQARGYLSKETVVTTVAGLVLGVILGAILTPPVITILQSTDLALVKDFNVIAWAFAVGIETIFAIVINSLVFRKVKNLDLKDIAS